jgi:hypothetical protein
MRKCFGIILFLFFYSAILTVKLSAAPGVSPASPAQQINGTNNATKQVGKSTGEIPKNSANSITDVRASFLSGAYYLRHLQSDITEDNAENGAPDNDRNDGGWDWTLTGPNFTHSAVSSPKNLYGVCALGLYYAFQRTGLAAFKTSLDDAAGFVISDAAVKDAWSMKLLILYNSLPQVLGTNYRDAAKAKFDAQIAAHGGTALSFAEYIRDQRAAQNFKNGIIGWDLGSWAVVAEMLSQYYGAAYHQMAVTIAETAYNASFVPNANYFDLTRCAGWDASNQTRDYLYYNLGLTGLIDAFRAANVHTDLIPGLVSRLYSGQAASGGFCNSYGTHANDEDWQATAYAVMALGEYYKSIGSSVPSVIVNALNFLSSTQHTSGGWVYSDNSHYPEEGGECTSAYYYYDAIPGAAVIAAFTQTTAAVSSVIQYNGAVITDMGFCWSTNHNPSILDNHISVTPVQAGTFSAVLQNLTAASLYYIRPYIITSMGTTYGAETQLITLPYPPAAINPANGAAGVSILPDFQWNMPLPAYLTALSYDLKIYDGANVVFERHFITGNSYQLLETDYALVNNHNYTWTITANLNIGYTVTSSSTFTTSAPAKPVLYTPGQGATVYTYSPVMQTWSLNQAVGNLTFMVQYINQLSLGSSSAVPSAANWNNTMITSSVNAGSSIYLNSINLLSGTKYWWRVITYRNGEVISFSDNQWFQTSGGAAMATAIPSWPVGGAKVYSNNPVCYWYTNSGDLTDISFDLVVSNNTAFDNTLAGNVVYTYHTANLSAQISDLLSPGAVYYWKVITYYRYFSASTYVQRDVPAVYSSFTVNGASTVEKPVLSYPCNINVYTQSPVFYWYLNASASGINYFLYIDGTCTDAAVTDQFSITTSRTLAPGAHTWYVAASNGNHSYDKVSDTKTFTVDGGIIQGKPTASWPLNNAVMYTQSPAVSWYVSGSTTGLTKFRVAWSTDAGANWGTLPSTNYADIADINQRTVTLPAFVYGAHIYWAVASYVSSTASVWSTGEFTIFNSTGTIVPVLSYPIGGASVYTTSVNLSWYINGASSGVQYYKVEYSGSSSFTNPIIVEPVNSTSVALDNLTPGATYYWRVSAFNGYSYSNPSTTGIFTVVSGAYPVVPVAGSPSNGVALTTNSPTLSWALPAKSGSVLQYDLEYSTSKEMNSAEKVSGINSLSAVLPGLKAGQTYYWRVRSTSQDGTVSGYSPVESFSVNSVNAVVENNAIPAEFELKQNYPNPFNPSTVISYNIPENGHITLKVYDILGKEVSCLVNEEKTAGSYKVAFGKSGLNLSSGVYIYRLTFKNASKFISEVKKMSLIK